MMILELEDRRITVDEIERLTGLEVSDYSIGGVLWGTYRWPLKSHLFSFVITELLMLGLCVMLATPVGLALMRNPASDQQVLWGVGAIASLLWTIRQLLMMVYARQLQTFMRLLNEVDAYHRVLETVVLLDQLGTTGAIETDQSQISVTVLDALDTARNSLVASLITEQLLRKNQGLRSRQEALIETVEENLLTLRSLELQHQAQEYSEILEQALNIGVRVQHEMTHLKP